MKQLHVSAGGRGERIATYTASIKPDLPKHLLPIPVEGKTLLGEITRQARDHFDQVVIWASETGLPHIASAVAAPAVSVCVDTDMTGPLGPMVRELLTRQQRTYGCAGDFYCDFSWGDFESFHDSHGLPVSILVARSVAAPGGARFNLSTTGAVLGWERVACTTEEDRINIGCYILDPAPEVERYLATMPRHKEDPFFDHLIAAGCVAGCDPGKLGFNVNVPEVYQALLRTFQ